MAKTNLDDLIKSNTPRLKSFVKSRVSNTDDADDIVQDTLYQLLRTISIMDNPISHVSSWLNKVANNLVINHGKKHREVTSTLTKQRNGGEEDSFMIELSEIMATPDYDSPDMLMLRNMVWEELKMAMADLPKEQREAIELTEVQGLTTKEAALAMGVSPNTFLSRKHYGIVSIRKRLYLLYKELVHNS